MLKVQSAWGAYNYIIMHVPFNDIEMKVKMDLAHVYVDMESAENYTETVFLQGKIDFFECILDYE